MSLERYVWQWCLHGVPTSIYANCTAHESSSSLGIFKDASAAPPDSSPDWHESLPLSEEPSRFPLHCFTMYAYMLSCSVLLEHPSDTPVWFL